MTVFLTNKEILEPLEQKRWLLIVGQSGIEKTREATEVAQIFNKEDWRILWLKLGGWFHEPIPQDLEKIGATKKLLFFLDDFNNGIPWSQVQNNPKAAYLS